MNQQLKAVLERRERVTKRWHLDVQRDGDYLTLFADNEMVCVDTHFSQVPEVYLNWIKEFMGPGELDAFQMPPQLLDKDHPDWTYEETLEDTTNEND